MGVCSVLLLLMLSLAHPVVAQMQMGCKLEELFEALPPAIRGATTTACGAPSDKVTMGVKCYLSYPGLVCSMHTCTGWKWDHYNVRCEDRGCLIDTSFTLHPKAVRLIESPGCHIGAVLPRGRRCAVEGVTPNRCQPYYCDGVLKGGECREGCDLGELNLPYHRFTSWQMLSEVPGDDIYADGTEVQIKLDNSHCERNIKCVSGTWMGGLGMTNPIVGPLAPEYCSESATSCPPTLIGHSCPAMSKTCTEPTCSTSWCLEGKWEPMGLTCYSPGCDFDALLAPLDWVPVNENCRGGGRVKEGESCSFDVPGKVCKDVTCTKSGWNGTAQCEVGCRYDYDVPSSCTKGEVYGRGHTCTTTECPTVVITCGSKGWDGYPLCPRCDVKGLNVMVSCQTAPVNNKVPEGEKCTGVDSNPCQTATCQADESWLPSTITCDEKYCTTSGMAGMCGTYGVVERLDRCNMASVPTGHCGVALCNGRNQWLECGCKFDDLVAGQSKVSLMSTGGGCEPSGAVANGAQCKQDSVSPGTHKCAPAKCVDGAWVHPNPLCIEKSHCWKEKDFVSSSSCTDSALPPGTTCYDPATKCYECDTDGKWIPCPPCDSSTIPWPAGASPKCTGKQQTGDECSATIANGVCETVTCTNAGWDNIAPKCYEDGCLSHCGAIANNTECTAMACDFCRGGNLFGCSALCKAADLKSELEGETVDCKITSPTRFVNGEWCMMKPKWGMTVCGKATCNAGKWDYDAACLGSTCDLSMYPFAYMASCMVTSLKDQESCIPKTSVQGKVCDAVRCDNGMLEPATHQCFAYGCRFDDLRNSNGYAVDPTTSNTQCGKGLVVEVGKSCTFTVTGVAGTCKAKCTYPSTWSPDEVCHCPERVDSAAFPTLLCTPPYTPGKRCSLTSGTHGCQDVTCTMGTWSPVDSTKPVCVQDACPYTDNEVTQAMAAGATPQNSDCAKGNVVKDGDGCSYKKAGHECEQITCAKGAWVGSLVCHAGACLKSNVGVMVDHTCPDIVQNNNGCTTSCGTITCKDGKWGPPPNCGCKYDDLGSGLTSPAMGCEHGKTVSPPTVCRIMKAMHLCGEAVCTANGWDHPTPLCIAQGSCRYDEAQLHVMAGKPQGAPGCKGGGEVLNGEGCTFPATGGLQCDTVRCTNGQWSGPQQCHQGGCSFDSLKLVGVATALGTGCVKGQVVPDSQSCDVRSGGTLCGTATCKGGSFTPAMITCPSTCQTSQLPTLPGPTCTGDVTLGTKCTWTQGGACEEVECGAQGWSNTMPVCLPDGCFLDQVTFSSVQQMGGTLVSPQCHQGAVLADKFKCEVQKSGAACSPLECSNGMWVHGGCIDDGCTLKDFDTAVQNAGYPSVLQSPPGCFIMDVVSDGTACSIDRTPDPPCKARCLKGSWNSLRCGCNFNALGIPVASMVTSNCGSGFIADGTVCSFTSSTMQCDPAKCEDGVWKGDLPACIGLTECRVDQITHPMSATPVRCTAAGVVTAGTVCKFQSAGETCGAATCEMGTWNRQVECYPDGCEFDALVLPMGLTAVETGGCSPGGVVRHTEECAVKSLSLPAQSCDSAKCTKGVWTTPQCHSCELTMAMIPLQAMSSCAVGFVADGTMCTFDVAGMQCQPTTCMRGSWSVANPSCTPLKCTITTAMIPPNAMSNCMLGDVPDGTQCTFTAPGKQCETTTCQQGVWSNPNPSCTTAGACSFTTAMVPPGASSSCSAGDVPSNTQCTLTLTNHACESTTCLSGTWSNPNPMCVPEGCTFDDLTITMGTVSQQNSDPGCQPARVVEKGHVCVIEGPSGAVCQTPKCEGRGKWSFNQPKCLPEGCLVDLLTVSPPDATRTCKEGDVVAVGTECGFDKGGYACGATRCTTQGWSAVSIQCIQGGCSPATLMLPGQSQCPVDTPVADKGSCEWSIGPIKCPPVACSGGKWDVPPCTVGELRKGETTITSVTIEVESHSTKAVPTGDIKCVAAVPAVIGQLQTAEDILKASKTPLVSVGATKTDIAPLGVGEVVVGQLLPDTEYKVACARDQWKSRVIDVRTKPLPQGACLVNAAPIPAGASVSCTNDAIPDGSSCDVQSATAGETCHPVHCKGGSWFPQTPQCVAGGCIVRQLTLPAGSMPASDPNCADGRVTPTGTVCTYNVPMAVCEPVKCEAGVWNNTKPPCIDGACLVTDLTVPQGAMVSPQCNVVTRDGEKCAIDRPGAVCQEAECNRGSWSTPMCTTQNTPPSVSCDAGKPLPCTWTAHEDNSPTPQNPDQAVEVTINNALVISPSTPAGLPDEVNQQVVVQCTCQGPCVDVVVFPKTGAVKVTLHRNKAGKTTVVCDFEDSAVPAEKVSGVTVAQLEVTPVNDHPVFELGTVQQTQEVDVIEDAGRPYVMDRVVTKVRVAPPSADDEDSQTLTSSCSTSAPQLLSQQPAIHFRNPGSGTVSSPTTGDVHFTLKTGVAPGPTFSIVCRVGDTAGGEVVVPKLTIKLVSRTTPAYKDSPEYKDTPQYQDYLTSPAYKQARKNSPDYIPPAPIDQGEKGIITPTLEQQQTLHSRVIRESGAELTFVLKGGARFRKLRLRVLLSGPNVVMRVGTVRAMAVLQNNMTRSDDPHVVVSTDMDEKTSKWGLVATAKKNPRLIKHSLTDDYRTFKLTIKDPDFRAYTPNTEHIRVRFSEAVFEPGSEEACPNTNCAFEYDLRAEVPEPPGQEAAEQARDVAVASAVSVAAVMPAAQSSAGNMVRLSLVSRAMLCPGDGPDKLDRTLNPLNLELGGEDLQSYHGAVVGGIIINVVLLALCSTAALIIHRVAYTRGRSPTRMKVEEGDGEYVQMGDGKVLKRTKYLPVEIDRRYVLLKSRFGWLLIPYSFLYGGAALGCVTVIIYSSWGYRVLALLFFLAFVVGFPVYVFRTVKRTAMFTAYVPVKAETFLKRVFWGQFEWAPREDVPGSSVWLGLHHLVYDAYTYKWRYFLFFEMVHIFLLSSLTAWQPATRDECWARAAGMTALLAVFAGTLIIVRPYIAPYENIAEPIIAVMEFVMMLFTLFAMADDDPTNHWGAVWSVHLGEATMWAIIVKFVMDASVFVIDEYQTWVESGGNGKILSFLHYWFFFGGAMDDPNYYIDREEYEEELLDFNPNDDGPEALLSPNESIFAKTCVSMDNAGYDPSRARSASEEDTPTSTLRQAASFDHFANTFPKHGSGRGSDLYNWNPSSPSVGGPQSPAEGTLREVKQGPKQAIADILFIPRDVKPAAAGRGGPEHLNAPTRQRGLSLTSRDGAQPPRRRRGNSASSSTPCSRHFSDLSSF